MNPETLKKLNKAKILLMSQKNTTFFSSMLANLKLVVLEPGNKLASQMPTAATDGLNLYINEDFINTLNTHELLGLLVHEVYHVALEHVNRSEELKLDHTLWNVAGDYYINNDLVKRNYKLPEGGLIDYRYSNMSTMQIYLKLKEDQKDFPNFISDIINSDKLSKEDQEKIITNIVKAATQAKLDNDYGSIPGNIQRRLEEIINPKLPWNSILANALNSHNKDDYSWRRFNKKYWPDFYLPGMYSENLDRIAVFIDVSGSINQEDLDKFLAEIRYIWETLKPKEITISSFDTEITSAKKYTEGDYIEDLAFTGGGGTNISPVVDVLVDDSPEIAIIFSDMEFNTPYLNSVESDLIWIRVGKYSFEPSKGVIIDYE